MISSAHAAASSDAVSDQSSPGDPLIGISLTQLANRPIRQRRVVSVGQGDEDSGSSAKNSKSAMDSGVCCMDERRKEVSRPRLKLTAMSRATVGHKTARSRASSVSLTKGSGEGSCVPLDQATEMRREKLSSSPNASPDLWPFRRPCLSSSIRPKAILDCQTNTKAFALTVPVCTVRQQSQGGHGLSRWERQHGSKKISGS